MVVSTSIFISRHLSSVSLLLGYLQQENLTYDDRSLIHFEKLSYKLPVTDWLFFYSKTAVDMFLSDHKSVVNSYKTAFFGAATARHYEANTQIKATYVGNVDAQTVYDDLVHLIGPQSITFIIGKNSLRSVQKQSCGTKGWQECLIYDNRPKEKMKLSAYDIAIMTSPMNVASFYNNKGTADQFISIGLTTHAALSELMPHKSLHVASSPNEEGILKTLIQLITDR